MSRQIWVRREAERDSGHDDQTVVMPVLLRPGPPRGSHASGSTFEGAFRRDYGAIRHLLNDHPRPGLAVFVAGHDGLEASAWIGASPTDVEPLILGRHTSADLFLPSDPLLSLRHLAIIVHPCPRGASVRFRVLDLRTATAFADEGGGRLEAVESEGPVMLRCASFSLLLLPTGAGNDAWPKDPEAAWARIPARVYVERESADPDRWLLPAGHTRVPAAVLPAVGSGPPTLISSFPGPIFPHRILDGSGPARGEIVVASETGRVSLRLGAAAAHRGVLIGRYDRCDTAGLPVLSSDSLSRVHLLVIDVGGVLWAVDTSSQNGTWLEDRRVRCARLEPGRRLTLARHAVVAWRFLH